MALTIQRGSGATFVASGSALIAAVQYNGTTQNHGMFDGGTSTPVDTDRLNYDGYLYASNFVGPLTGHASLDEYFLGIPTDSSTLIINTVAGINSYGSTGNGGAALSAKIAPGMAVAVDSVGNFYFTDTNFHVVRKVTVSTGIITVYAGTTGSNGYSGDGASATSAQLNAPRYIVFDSSNNAYISDNGNFVIRRVDHSTGFISTVAGNQAMGAGFSGDGNVATSAQLNNPCGVALDSNGYLYIADQNNNVIRKVVIGGNISTFAGQGPPATAGYSGDGGSATSAKLNTPNGIAIDSNNNLYIADLSNNVLRKVVISTGIITTVAGTGSVGYSGDNGNAIGATFFYCEDVSVDPIGNIYIGDNSNNVIRKINKTTNIITTYAGEGPPTSAGYSGDTGNPTSAQLSVPRGMAFDTLGNMYIADTANYVIRQISGITYFEYLLQSDTAGNRSWTLLSKASSSVFGIVEIGSNISVSNGVISLTSGNVDSALGYTPYNGATNPNGYLTLGTLPIASSSVFGIVEVDNVTITASAGVISATFVASGSASVGGIKYNGNATPSAGMFDGSSTNPTATTRANYDGNLYAHALYDTTMGGSVKAYSDARWTDIKRYGFVDDTQTTISFNPVNYTFTLTDAGAGWDYIWNGIAYHISGNVSVQIANPPVNQTQYFISLTDGIGTLGVTNSRSYTDGTIPVAGILWDATLTPKYWMNDDRHNCYMDSWQIFYHHSVLGVRYLNGGVPSGWVDTDTAGSANNADNCFAISACSIFTANLNPTLSALAQPTGSGTDYAVFYRTAIGAWAWELNNVPYPYAAGTYIQWDNNGVLTTGTGTHYYNSYLLYSSISGAARFMIIPGRGAFTSLATAQAESVSTFDFTGLGITEFVIGYQFTWETGTSSTSSGKCRLVAPPVFVNVAISSSNSASVPPHNGLSGLQGGLASTEFYHLTVNDYSTAIEASNYIAESSFENGLTTGWNLYNDGAVSTPVAGSGGVVSNLTFSAITSSPLFGTTASYDGQLSKAAFNCKGEGVSYDFALDFVALTQDMKIQFAYKTSTGYASGDVGIYIYDINTTTIITPVVSSLPANTTGTVFYTSFTPDSTSTANNAYRIIFHIKTVNASAWTLDLDNVIVSLSGIASFNGIGLVKPDGSTITINGAGIITTPAATTSTLGAVLPDGLTILESSSLMSNGNCESTTPPSITGQTPLPPLNGTFVRSSAQAHTGTYSYKYTPTSSGTNYAYLTAFNNNSLQLCGFIPGHSYTLIAWAYIPTGTAASTVTIEVDYYNSGSWTQNYLSAASTYNAWQILTLSVTIPSTATGVDAYLFYSSTSNSQWVYFDDFSLVDDSLPTGTIYTQNASTSLFGSVKVDGTTITSNNGVISAASVPIPIIQSYITEYSFEDNLITGWATYNDGAVATPIDGTGGAVTNIALTSSSSTPLLGVYSGLLTKSGTANCQGEGFSYAFTIDNALAYQPQSISFYYQTATYTTGDLTVYIYDVTNGVLIPPSTISIPSSTTPSLFQASWVPSSTSTSYRLIFHIATVNTANWTFEYDQVFVGKTPYLTGTAISGWTAYTPVYSTGVPGTNTTKLQWRRVGSNMEITYVINQTAAGTNGSGIYALSLPTGYTIDTTNLILDDGSSQNGSDVGSATFFNGSSFMGVGIVSPFSTTQIIVRGLNASATPAVQIVYWGSTVQQFGTTTIRVALICSVPISQWTSNINLVTDFTEYVWNTTTSTTTDQSGTNNGYGSGGAAIQAFAPGAFGVVTKRVTFQRPIQATDLIILEIYDGVSWGVVPHGGIATRGPILNTDIYGMYFNTIDSTHVDVVFQNKANEGNWAWSTYSATYRWRVRKTSQGNFAESFPPATLTLATAGIPNNYIANTGFEQGNTTGYATYNDGAVAIPVDGTGGSPTVTFAVNSTTPLYGVWDAIFTKPASNVQGQGFSYDFSIDQGATTQTLLTSFYFFNSAAFLAGDVLMFIYDTTNNVLVSTSAVPIQAIGVSTYYSMTWTPNTNSKNYRLIFHIASISASGWTFEIDNIFTGVYTQAVTAAISGWTQYSPTIGAVTTAPTPGTGTIIEAFWRRVGTDMEIKYHFLQTAAGTAGSGSYLFPLPSGYTIDYSKMDPVGDNTIGKYIGWGIAYDVTTGAYLPTNPYVTSTNGSNILLGASSLSGSNVTITPNLIGSTYFSLSDAHVAFDFFAKVPISQWTSNINLVTDFTEYAWNSTTTTTTDQSGTNNGYGTNGAAIESFVPTGTTAVNKRITFQKPIQATDLIRVEFNVGSGFWIDALIQAPFGGTSSTYYGVQLNPVDSTHMDLAFYSLINTSGAGWSVASGAGWRWRVRKTSQGNFAEAIGNNTALSISVNTAIPVSAYNNTLINITTGSSAITATLPALSGSHKRYRGVKVDTGSGTAILAAAGSDKIGAAGNATSFTLLAQGDRVDLEDNGTYWDVVSTNGPVIKSVITSTQTASVGAAAYSNLGGSVALTPGVWDLYWEASPEDVTAGDLVWATLSTTNTTETDYDLTSRTNLSAAGVVNPLSRFKLGVIITANTTYYLNISHNTGTHTIGFLAGSTAGNIIISARRVG